MMADWKSREVEPALEALTRREREVLALLAQGYAAREIAQELTLAVSSVKWHLQHIYGKLGANSKRQAIARARALGLLAANGAAPEAPRAPTHNLPLQVTRFFGREHDLISIEERLAEWRLVTLTGPGGVGKTRLALRAAEALQGNFTDGAWLVELAPLADASLVAQAVAAALSVREVPGRPALESVTAFLREREAVLVLDNCEHLLDACARLAEALLRMCPRVRILATSREALAIAGEAVYPVASLAFPDPERLPSLAHVDAYDAVKLFVDRARAVSPSYRVAAQNAAALARICQRLDGLPLAIEMAAARVHTLSAEELAGRLEDAFRVLTGGSRTALPRHQTLRATLDWSYELLIDAERLLFQRLGLFAGGCTLEAVETICSGDGLTPEQVLELLAALVAKSMVIAERRPGAAARYRLLEMVRQYAVEKLEAAGEGRRGRTRHRDYYLAFAETNAPQLGLPDRGQRARKLQTERENLRRALEWSFSDLAAVDAGPRLIIAMFGLWPSVQETLAWSRRGLALCQSRADMPGELYAQMLGMASTYTALNEPAIALDLVQQAVAVSRQLGPTGRKTLMRELALLGWRYLRDLHEVTNAQGPYQEAEAILDALGPEAFAPAQYSFWKAWFAGIKSNIALAQGRYAAAKTHASESIQRFETGGNRWCFQHADARIYLGAAHLYLAEYEAAEQHFSEAVCIAEALNDDHGQNRRDYALYWLAMLDLHWGRLARAQDYSERCIRQCALVPDYNIIAACLGISAAIAARQGKAVRATTLSAASQAMIGRQGRRPWVDFGLDSLLPGWRERDDFATLAEAFAAGQAMTNEQAVAYALDGSVEAAHS
jgi:predicted ATPase/DNA-binding CsgD family transcriptional regulator